MKANSGSWPGEVGKVTRLDTGSGYSGVAGICEVTEVWCSSFMRDGEFCHRDVFRGRVSGGEGGLGWGYVINLAGTFRHV